MSISASRYRSSLTLKSLASLTPPDYRLIFDFYSPPKQSKCYNVGSAVDHVITCCITSDSSLIFSLLFNQASSVVFHSIVQTPLVWWWWKAVSIFVANIGGPSWCFCTGKEEGYTQCSWYEWEWNISGEHSIPMAYKTAIYWGTCYVGQLYTGAHEICLSR